MAKNEGVVMSAANLDIIENNLGQLATNLGQVSFNVGAVDSKVNSVTESVKTIEEEIKNFMIEIRSSTITANARQVIMQNETEINKKYGHYDSIRRRTSGLLQASDLRAITKSSVRAMGEEILVDTPDYWLAPAFIALSAWLSDDKELAERSLKEAMNRDDEKTSLLFALIHARAGRTAASNKWLTRYLNMQDPLAMEAKVAVVLDAISSGIFGPSAKDLALESIHKWITALINYPQLKEAEINRVKNYISYYKKETEEQYSFIEEFSDAYLDLKEALALNNGKDKFLTDIINKFNKPSLSKNKEKKVDELLASLVFDYENEELNLRKEITRNKLIVEEAGNITNANKRFEDISLAYEKDNNFYTLIVNISLGLHHTSEETVKLALSLAKDIYIEAYKEVLKDNNLSEDKDISLKIDDWNGRTKNASDEKELLKSLENHFEAKLKTELAKESLFNFKMILSIVLGITAIFLTFKNITLSFIILILVIIFNIYQLVLIFVKRREIEKALRKDYDNQKYLLMNLIAEIVDYKTICYAGRINDEKTITYLNNLDYQQYLKTDGQRNIEVGGAYE